MGMFTPSTPPSLATFTPSASLGATPFDPAAALTPETFTPVPVDALRRVKYGDHPPMNGSITYGQLVPASGFFQPPPPPDSGAFTPAA